MDNSKFAAVADAMRAEPVTIDRARMNDIEAATVAALERCQTPEDASALVAELIHMIGIVTARMIVAADAHRVDPDAFKNRSYQFDRMMQDAERAASRLS